MKTNLIATVVLVGTATLFTAAGAQTMIALPPYQSTYSMATVRGFYLQAPVDFEVVGLRVPDELKNGKQDVCLYRHTSAPSAYPQTVGLTPVFSRFGVPSSTIIRCSIRYRKGDWFIAVGACGGPNWYHNSCGTIGPYQTHVLGATATLYRCGIHSGIATLQPPHPIWSETSGNPARVEVYVSFGASIVGVGTGAVGTTQVLYLTSGTEPGLPYQLGSSLGTGPIPLDSRQLGLSADALLLVSAGGLWPAVFDGYRGTLDFSGKGTARLHIPNLASLKGIKVHSAFVTRQASAPSGISSISRTYSFDIQ